ncbi:hypothetical protein PF005_g32138 [Phytophthora fragariae]|uniref:Uncharacterized protein n=1 Tax=Phytophthora fragariae TaxID=53985 RepID=A0A6A3V1L5_9STRA|nr:hypothetical protein PF005_g32138 [Phytophthora fragariae]
MQVCTPTTRRPTAAALWAAAAAMTTNARTNRSLQCEGAPRAKGSSAIKIPT